MVLFIGILTLWLNNITIEEEPVINQIRVLVNDVYEQVHTSLSIEDDLLIYNQSQTNLGMQKGIHIKLVDLKGQLMYEDPLLGNELNNDDSQNPVYLKEILYMDHTYTQTYPNYYKVSMPLILDDMVMGFMIVEVDKNLIGREFQESNVEFYLLLMSISAGLVFVFLGISIFRKDNNNELEEFKKHLEDLGKGKMSPILICDQHQFKDLYNQYNIAIEELSYMYNQENDHTQKRKEFLTMISHELKTPIATINAYIEGLVKGVAKDEDMRQRYQNVIHDKMQQLTKQIEELFKYAQEEAGQFKYHFEELYMDEVFGVIVASLSGQTKHSIRVEHLIPHCLCLVDKIRLEQVIMNLVNNAIKHSDQESDIIIKGYRQDHEIIIEVIDTGEGINPTDMPYIFDYYYQGKHEKGIDYEGVGLGLAICKDIITKHNGSMKVKSVVGEGSVFTVIIPVV